MKITLHAKQEAVRFDQRWRASLGTGEYSRRTPGDVKIPDWWAKTSAGLLFAHESGTASGRVDFEAGERVPHPSSLAQSLGFDAVWLFSTDLSWAVRTGHEDWDRLELFEKADSLDETTY